MALQALNGKAAQVRSAGSRPWLSGKRGGRGTKNAHCQVLRVRSQGGAPLVCLPMLDTDKAVRKQMKEGGLAQKRYAANHAMAQVWEPPQQACGPKSEVGDRHPDVVHPRLLQHREQQAEYRVVGIVIRKRLLEAFREKSQGR